MVSSKCIVQVRQGDLIEGDSLVLVNASNTNGVLGTGASGFFELPEGSVPSEILDLVQRLKDRR